MSNSFKEQLSARYNMLSDSVNKLNNQIKDLPAGKIYIKYRNDKPYYYLRSKNARDKYLRLNDESIHLLIQKEYTEDVVNAEWKELDLLRKVIARYPVLCAEDLYDQLPCDRKKYVEPIILGEDIQVEKWINAPYDRPGFKTDSPEFISLKGDRVRSKSEMIIADRLWANGIPYKYECPLLVGNEIIHPDFSILRRSDKKIVYHEHCGMVDNPEYSKNMVNRINAYNSKGIYLGDRLFISMETSDIPLDVRIIDNLIRTKFR